jgi:hypothetical protein
MPAEVASGIVSYGPQLLQLVSAGVPIALLMKWGSYRERSWKFSQRKTRALRKLIEKDEWRDAPALHVQYAFQDAFGRSFDRAELAFIEGRQRPLALIKDRLAGGAFLKFKEDDSGYERNASASMQKLSLKFWSRLWISVSWALAVATLFILGTAISKGQWGLVFPTVDSAMLSAAAWIICHALDSAMRVLDPENYVEARPVAKKVKKTKAPKGPKTLEMAKQAELVKEVPVCVQ